MILLEAEMPIVLLSFFVDHVARFTQTPIVWANQPNSVRLALSPIYRALPRSLV